MVSRSSKYLWKGRNSSEEFPDHLSVWGRRSDRVQSRVKWLH